MKTVQIVILSLLFALCNAGGGGSPQKGHRLAAASKRAPAKGIVPGVGVSRRSLKAGRSPLPGLFLSSPRDCPRPRPAAPAKPGLCPPGSPPPSCAKSKYIFKKCPIKAKFFAKADSRPFNRQQRAKSAIGENQSLIHTLSDFTNVKIVFLRQPRAFNLKCSRLGTAAHSLITLNFLINTGGIPANLKPILFISCLAATASPGSIFKEAPHPGLVKIPAKQKPAFSAGVFSGFTGSVELVMRFERTTCSLRVSCSTS